MMYNKKEKNLDRVINNISRSKINRFCELLTNSQIRLSDDIFKIKRELNLDSKEENYFQNLCLNFENEEDLIILLKLKMDLKKLKKEIVENTSLSWSGPIKYHEKIDQTYSTFLKMISNAKNTIIFVGYAMRNSENEEIFKALKNAAKERDVKIKIIFDKATKSKKLGTWTQSPEKIIRKIWEGIERFPEIYSYDDNRSSLHAKFLLIDDIEIFVTSANMTDRAMTRNLEIGIRHKGNIAKDVSELIDLLIRKKIVTKITHG